LSARMTRLEPFRMKKLFERVHRSSLGCSPPPPPPPTSLSLSLCVFVRQTANVKFHGIFSYKT
jgi:hypothetical protein